MHRGLEHFLKKEGKASIVLFVFICITIYLHLQWQVSDNYYLMGDKIGDKKI